MTSNLLQEPYTVRGLTVPNRCVVPPMCTFLVDPDTPGIANDQHLVHYGSIAESGVGFIIVEATAVQHCGLISPSDLGLWTDDQIEPTKRIVDYVHKYTQSKVAVQLAHAGRKGITKDTMSNPIHLGPEDKYGKQCVSASAIAHSPTMLVPHELSLAEIEQMKADWVSAAKRAVAAGYDAIEIHGAHGYLLNQFSSAVSNHRSDQYGGSLENRLRLPLEIAEAVRNEIPESMPLIYRISVVDWVEEGTTIEESAVYAAELTKRGVDLIHCSSGGVSYQQDIRLTFGTQIKFAEEMKNRTGARTIAVGGLKSYEQAEEVLQNGQADLVAIGRAYLEDAYWWRNNLIRMGVVPWHPPRQSMGFFKSIRKTLAEEAKKKQASETGAADPKDVVASS